MNQSLLLISYNGWANRRLMEQILTLSEEEFTRELGGSFPSIQRTLIHLLEADWLWLQRWKNSPVSTFPTDWDTSTPQSINAIRTAIDTETEALLRNRLPGHESENLVFKTRRGDPVQMPNWQVVSHAVNHSSYHRGQLANMIRLLGHTPVATDLFLFFDQENRKSFV